MPRQPNTETRRSEIVAAMLTVMASHGYDKATIQLIAKAAGLTPGLIHYHFASKREILLALVHTLGEQAEVRRRAALAGVSEPAGRLRAHLQARLGQGEGENPGAVAAWVVIGAEALRQPEVREVYQQAVATELAALTELLDACLRAQGRAVVHAPRLAAALLAFMEGAFQLASATEGIMPSGYAADTALALAERFMQAEPKA